MTSRTRTSREAADATAGALARTPAWVWLLCAALVLVKLWATSTQRLFAIGDSRADDLHFLIQAAHLLAGEWLGPYNSTTLIKGPLFPAWVALTFRLGVPLLLSAQLFHAFACGVLTFSVRPWLRRSIYVPAFFAILLFNPISNSADLTRVDREMIAPALTALVAACAIQVLRLRGLQGRSWWGWAAGLGVSFAALWLVREEQPVVLPFLFFVLAGTFALAWRYAGVAQIKRVLAGWLAALSVWAAIVYSVAACNYFNYGLFAKTEFDAHSFNAAYGALSRVKPPEFKFFVPVSNKTRKLIYPVSPAFQELRPYLEGYLGSAWINAGLWQQDSTNAHEILGGWFMWALRDAVDHAGYYSSGKYPDEYYSRLAAEVNAACARHWLDCYPPRVTFLPVWHNAYLRPWLASFVDKQAEAVGFRTVHLDPFPSEGPAADFAFFRRLTHDLVTSPGEYYVEIETLTPGATVDFKVTDASGVPVASWITSPLDSDLTRDLSLIDAPHADPSQFHLVSGMCTNACSLEMSTGGTLRVRLKFDEIVASGQILQENGLKYRVLAYGTPVPPAPDRSPLERAPLATLKAILRTYQMFHPILALIAVVIYGLLTLQIGRDQAKDELWVGLSGLAIFSVSRIVLISFMNISALRIWPGAYLWQAYPTMLAFVGLACLTVENILARREG